MSIELFCQDVLRLRCYEQILIEIGVLEGGGSVSAKFHVEGDVPHQSFFAQMDRPYNFVADGSRTEKLRSRLSSRDLQF